MTTTLITEEPPLQDTTMADDHSRSEASITALIEVAHTNGVDVENGIDLHHRRHEMPSWTVEITEIANSD